MRLTVLVIGLLAVGVLALPASAADWPQWRGVQRDGTSSEVPLTLPAKQLLWRKPLAGATDAGIAVSGHYLIVLDHGADTDYIRCYAAETGEAQWTQSYKCKAEMDYGACPRATPLIADGRVFTLSALGDLYCCDLASGKVLWKQNLPATYKATLPQYGYSSSPIMVDGKLIVNPGGKQASLVALDPATGKVIWQTPGKAAAYGSFIAGTFGGRLQLVGYDADSLGGWDIATGKRLWTLTPENPGDYNVSTPVNLNGKLLVATDINYIRVYDFTNDGLIVPKPVAVNLDFGPDTSTPVVQNGLAFISASGLNCVDPKAGLKTAWTEDSEDALCSYASIIAGNNRLMVFTQSGVMYLVDAQGNKCQVLGHMTLCQQTLSHPALANGRLYIRDEKWLYCYQMK